MTLDILRRTGGWCVELQHPLKSGPGPGHEITQIEIRPSTADHMIRWVNFQIPSVLALLSELTDVPERILRQLPSQDFDRVMLAFHNLLPAAIKQDWVEGTRPLATPPDELPPQELIPPPDQLDPRYPSAGGPVVRMGPGPAIKPPSPPEEQGDGSGMNMAMPQTAVPVH
jgi:hypothetical protein